MSIHVLIAPRQYRMESRSIGERESRGSCGLEFAEETKLVRDLLVAVPQTAGGHALTWDGTDQRGGAVASGVYLFQIRTQRESRSVRATLLR